MEGGGCWDPGWEDCEPTVAAAGVAVVLVAAGMTLVGVKEERPAAIFWAARRAVIALSCGTGSKWLADHTQKGS